MTVLAIVAILAAGIVSAGVLTGSNSSSDLVAEYRFDTGGGNTVYDTAGDNDGTVNGASWTGGVYGDALSFDGSDDYIDVNKELLDGSSEVTLVAWIKPGTISSNAPGHGGSGDHVVGQAGSNGDDNVLINLGNNDEFEVYIDTGSNYETTSGSSPVETGKWQMVALTYDGSILKGWHNAKEIISTSASGDITNPGQALTAGAASDNNENFDGKIDGIRAYKDALNKSHLKTLYSQGSWRTGVKETKSSSQVLDIGFTEKNSTHVLDTSGYNTHGQIKNGASQETSGGCKVGRCYVFDGSDDYVNLGKESSLKGINGITIMGYFYNPSGSRWISKDRSDYWNLGDNGWEISDGSITDVNNGGWTDSIPSDTWTHVSATYNPDTGYQAVYIDGRLEASQNLSSPITIGVGSDRDAILGCNVEDDGSGSYSDGCNSVSYSGKMDQVKIFNRSLSQREIIEETEGLSSDGSVINFRFNRDGGDKVFDSSGESNHAIFYPNESYGPETAEGIQGGALEFDGSDDWAKASGVDYSILKNGQEDESWTLEIWAKPHGSQDRQESILLGRSGCHGGIYAEPDHFTFAIKTNDSTSCWNGAKEIHYTPSEMQGWQHLVAVYDNREMKFYANGELVDTKNFNDWMHNYGNTMQLGVSNRVFDGLLDEAKVYPYAFSKERIQKQYDKGLNGLETQNQESDLNSGLVLFQPFDRIETCGQSDTVSCPSGMSGEVAVDESGEANHGELANSPTEKSSGRCQKGGCLSFDGSDDYVGFGDINRFEDRSPFSVSIWLKNTPYDGTWRRLLSKEYNSNGNQGWHIRRPGNGNKMEFYREVDGDSGNYASLSYTPGEWQHFVFVYDGSSRKIYRDGSLGTSVSDTRSINGTTNSLELGRISGGGNHWDGSVDSLRVYNRSLSKDEVWQLYTKGRDRSSENSMGGPEGRWDFSSEYGGDIYDRSKEGNTGDWNSNGPATEKRYIVNEYHAGDSLRVAAYENDTEVTAGSCTKSLNRGDTKTFSSSCYSVTDTVTSDKPFSAHFTSGGSDGPVPESFAGKEFVYEDCREPEYFNIVAPYNSASVSVKNTSGTVASTSISAGGHKEINTDMPTGTEYTIESDSKILVTYDGNMRDTYMMHPASDNLWGMMEDIFVSKDNTHVTVYDSDGNVQTDGTFQKFDRIGGPGSYQSGSESVRVVANKSALGGYRCADGDNGETDIGVPNNRMAAKFRIPEEIHGPADGDESEDHYISFTTKGSATCKVYHRNGTLAAEKSTSTSLPNPGFMEFDDQYDFNLTETGAKAVCTRPAAVQWEPSTNQGESNLYGIDPRPEGKTGKALEFDGKDDYVTLDNSFTLEKEGATLAWWMNPGDTSSTGLFSNTGPGSYRSHVETRSNTIFAETDQNCHNFNLGQFEKKRGWNHYSIVFNQSRAYLYENGESLGEATGYGQDQCSGSSVNKLRNDTTLRYVGPETAYNLGFDGKIDDIRVYPHALEEDQVQRVMNGGGVGVGS